MNHLPSKQFTWNIKPYFLSKIKKKLEKNVSKVHRCPCLGYLHKTVQKDCSMNQYVKIYLTKILNLVKLAKSKVGELGYLHKSVQKDCSMNQ